MMDGPSRLAAAVLALAVLAAATFEVHNLDLPLHAVTGRWIVEQGEVPTVNVMSAIHRDHPTVHDKWLFQVAAHLLADGPGTDAVMAARVLLLAALFAVLASTARRLGAAPGAWLLVTLLALLASRSRFMFRPDLVSLVLLALVVRTCLATRPDGRGAWRLVPLQVLWVNVHGYFLQGPLVVLAVAAAHLAAGRASWPAARRWLAIGLAMGAACLANPAGLDGALHPFAILADLREHYDFYSTSIVEFRGTFAHDPRQPFDRLAFFGLGAAAAVALAVEAAVAWRARRASRAASALRAAAVADEAAPAAAGAAPAPAGAAPVGDRLAPALAALAVLALLGAQTVSLRRNMAPFAVAVAPLAAAALTRRLGPRVPGLALPSLLGAALVLGEVTDVTSVHDGLDRRSGWGRSAIAYPDAGIAFIAEHFPRAGVWTDFHYGSAFTGARWPRQVASTNGNTHGYPTSWLVAVQDATLGRDPLGFDELTARHGLDVALVPMACPLSLSLLKRDDWALVALGREEAVWVRRAAVAASLADGRAWLAEHDLPPRWRAGEPAGLLDTPSCGAVLGLLPRACPPRTEIDQALALLFAGAPALALQRAERALGLDGEDAHALALAGLAQAELGQVEAARARLRQALQRGLHGSLASQARQRLDDV